MSKPINMMTVTDAAEYLAVDEKTVRRWGERAIDPLPMHKIGGSLIRIYFEDLDAWIRGEAA